jgi:Peptidase family M28
MSAKPVLTIGLRSLFVILLFVGLVLGIDAQVQPSTTSTSQIPPAASLPTSHVCPACIRAHMDFLASDALQGRGSGTRDEWIAATYIGSELEQYGVEPAGDKGTFLQKATLVHQKLTAPPKLTFKSPGAQPRTIVWTHGKQMLAIYLGAISFSGPLQKVDLTSKQQPAIKPGAVLLLSGPEEKVRDATYEFSSAKASAVLVPEDARLHSHWKERGSKLPEQPVQVEGSSDLAMFPKYPVIAIKHQYLAVLDHLPAGALISMKSSPGPRRETFTWNVVGRVRGSDPTQQHSTLLLTAHLDHLGVGAPVNGDDIYNGADDDASGTVAVLEFARMMASQSRPRRTVTFALFGSEEKGGLGSTYFREHPPTPLKDIAAYLEFEMIGRPDSSVPAGTLWLTGWERSNLGPELAANGAKLVGDPHPDQQFFERSDNYVFAKAGVVAQTVSSYGLHKDYHQPSDDISHINFQHMDEAIDSLLKPVMWLANSDFVPQWNPGGRP